MAIYVDTINNTTTYKHEKDKNDKLIIFVEENNMDTYVHKQQPKPPLGVMPKEIYEFQRVQDLCRALYERSNFEEEVVDYDLMFKWSQELNDRLNYLQSNKLNKKIENDDESWDSL